MSQSVAFTKIISILRIESLGLDYRCSQKNIFRKLHRSIQNNPSRSCSDPQHLERCPGTAGQQLVERLRVGNLPSRASRSSAEDQSSSLIHNHLLIIRWNVLGLVCILKRTLVVFFSFSLFV